MHRIGVRFLCTLMATIALGLGLGLAQAETSTADTELWNDILNDRANGVLQQLAVGLDPNIKSEEGQPAVMWAIQNNSWQVYDLLRQHKDFDPNITNANNETPLMYLAILGELERAQQLQSQGAKINRLGWTPLHYAASKGQVEFARWLLSKDAFIHAPAPDGTTPLMMAAFSGNKAMVDLFLEAGADLKAVNIHRHTAVDWAESARHSRLADYLRALNSGDATLTTEATPEQDSATSEQSSSGQSSSKYFDLKRFE